MWFLICKQVFSKKGGFVNYTTGKTGKVIIVRLEDGEPIYKSIEKVAKTEQIKHAMVWVIGGMQNGKVVIGPEDENATPIQSMVTSFSNAHEIMGTGMLFPDKTDTVKLHMHAAIGHDKDIIVGCPRVNADCWLVNEIVIMEMVGVEAKRVMDEKSGFELLKID